MSRLKRWLFVPCIMLACHGRALAASGISLGWDTCGPGSSADKVFSCDTNSGNEEIVASFASPAQYDHVDAVGLEIMVGRSSNLTTVPDWWNFQTNGCRQGSLSASASLATTAPCGDIWLGQAAVDFVTEQPYIPISGPPGLAISVGISLPSPMARVVKADSEYFAARIIVDDAKTAGDSCAGCSDKVTLTLDEVTIYQRTPFTPVQVQLTNVLRRKSITWQGGIVSARSSTWGRIRQQYR